MAEATKPVDAAKPATSKAEPLECRVKKDFYSTDQRYIAEGETYFYTPALEGEPFPYPILEPVDSAIAKEKRAEWTEFDRKKQDEIAGRTSLRANLKSLSQMGE